MPGKPGMTGPNMGGRREGAGRPRIRLVVRRGDEYLMSRRTSEGVVPSEVLTVIEVTDALIRFQAGNDVITLVRPE